MAQVKLLKINASGFNEEHGAADDITFATITAATQLAVTGGTTITNNITFNAVTDTVGGIQNQNLVDKTAAEDISANWTVKTGYDLILEDAPVNDTDAANKAYVDSVATGLDWQDSVLDKDLTGPPGSPSTGDRYIVGPSASGTWSGHDEKIAEWNGSTWDLTTPNEGFAAWVEDEDVVYTYNGAYSAGNWVKMSSVYNHNDLAGLQGGQANEYYHLTSAQHTSNVVGQATPSSTDHAIARWDGTTGKIINDSLASVDDAGKLTAIGLDASTGLLYDNDVSSGVALGDASNTGLSGAFTATSLVGALNELKATNTAQNVEIQMTNGEASTMNKGQAAYISGNDTVMLADASAIATAKVLGLAAANINASAAGNIVRSGVITGILGSATAGAIYWLSESAGGITTTPPTTSGSVVIRVGAAKNATDFIVDIGNARIRA